MRGPLALSLISDTSFYSDTFSAKISTPHSISNIPLHSSPFAVSLVISLVLFHSRLCSQNVFDRQLSLLLFRKASSWSLVVSLLLGWRHELCLLEPGNRGLYPLWIIRRVTLVCFEMLRRRTALVF